MQELVVQAGPMPGVLTGAADRLAPDSCESFPAANVSRLSAKKVRAFGKPPPPVPPPRKLGEKPPAPSRKRKQAASPTTPAKRGSQLVLPACSDLHRFGRLTKIGAGAHGVVYRGAVRAADGSIRSIALKQIRGESSSEGFPFQEMREISLLQKTNHQNVIQLLDVAVSDRSGTHLVFDLCDFDLCKLLSLTRGAMPTSALRCVGLQMLRGLEHIHGLNILQ